MPWPNCSDSGVSDDTPTRSLSEQCQANTEPRYPLRDRHPHIYKFRDDHVLLRALIIHLIVVVKNVTHGQLCGYLKTSFSNVSTIYATKQVLSDCKAQKCEATPTFRTASLARVFH